MNAKLMLGALAVVATLALLPTAAAYPWGPNGPPPGDSCGGDLIEFNCGSYYWYCSPSYNSSPDICYWVAYDRCTVYMQALGCITRA